MLPQWLGTAEVEPTTILVSVSSATMIIGVLWSLIQRWDFALHLEAHSGRLRLSLRVARREE